MSTIWRIAAVSRTWRLFGERGDDLRTFDETPTGRILEKVEPGNRDRAAGPGDNDTSLTTHVSAFLGDGAFHQQHHECKHQCHHREDPEAVEIGECGSLLLTQVLERLPSQLL